MSGDLSTLISAHKLQYSYSTVQQSHLSSIAGFHVTKRPGFVFLTYCMEQMCLHERPLIIPHRQAFTERTDRNHHSLITVMAY